MEPDASLANLWAQFTTAVDSLPVVLTQIDPQYLLLGMGVLIWIQLGRIVRALKGSGGMPKDLPGRVDNLQAKVQSMSHEIADFQVYAAARQRPQVSQEGLTAYRDRTG